MRGTLRALLIGSAALMACIVAALASAEDPVVLAAGKAMLAQAQLDKSHGSDRGPPIDPAASVYDRVIKSGTIRASYLVDPPELTRDAAGKLSGISVDVLEEAARRLGLKVEWTGEVDHSSVFDGLLADREDMLGTLVWRNSSRGKRADFSVPLHYSGVGIYVRQADLRFSVDRAAIDDPGVRIAVMPGEMGEEIARANFPNAQRVAFLQIPEHVALLQEVADGAADVAFIENNAAQGYLKAHALPVRNIAVEQPIRVFPNNFMFKLDQPAFKSMLDATIEELVNSGFVDRVVAKYEVAPGAYYRLALPYRTTAPAEP
jgi:polar amino acid transport system substrate-binding protein